MRKSPYLFCLFLSLGLAACQGSHNASNETLDSSTTETIELDDELGEMPTAASATLRQDDDIARTLRQDADDLTLTQQRQRFLRDQYMANARELMEQLRLEDALMQAVLAVEIDKDSLDAKNLVAEINTLLGNPDGEVETVAAELASRHQILVQQMRADAAQALADGKVHLARDEYNQAIAELTIATNFVKWAPFNIDWQGIDAEAAALLERALTSRDVAEQQAREAQRREAYEQLQAEAAAERQRKEMVVANMMERAIESFANGKYDEAMDYADQALRKDPHAKRAEEIRHAAFVAGRDQHKVDYIEERREQFALWKEEIAQLRIPWTDVITVPDADRWAEITGLRSGRPGLDLSQSVDPGEVALRAELNSTMVPALVVEESESLSEVMDIVRTITNLPIVVHGAAENAAVDEGVIYSINLTNQLTARQVFDLIADYSGEEVTWTIRNDAVIFTTREKARDKPIIVNHDVQDLVFGLTDFLGPRIDRIRLLDELEDDDGGGPFGTVSERVKMIEEDDLSTLIQENVAVGTWEDEGIFIDVGTGYILVVHTPEVQAQVRAFLEDLRRSSGSLVTIESKFITVADNWLQELGVDFRGLDNASLPDVTNGLEDMSSLGLDNGGTGSAGQNAAGNPSAGAFFNDGQDGVFLGTTQHFFGEALGNAVSTAGGLTFQLTFLDDLQVSAILRAVEKQQELELVNNQVLSVHNTQRAYVAVINQQAFIQDFDVEVAQFQAVADPQINVLTEGVVLDVRPIIQHDRKYLTLEIQPTVANVVNLRDFSSTLGGNTSPVEFQLPELEVQSVFTTAVIPDGGSILLGGLSKVRNIERRAEVPWFARIPVVGFLFKEEGYSDEKESLKILIRATITDVRGEIDNLERGL